MTKSIKTTFLTPIAAVFCMTMAGNVVAESSTAEAYHSIDIFIYNSSGQDMPLTAHIDCSEPSPTSIKFADDQATTFGKILSGGAPGQCTLTFSVSSSDSSEASVTDLPISLLTTSESSQFSTSKFTSISAENANTTTPISNSNGYQVTTSFNQNTMIATINKAT